MLESAIRTTPLPSSTLNSEPLKYRHWSRSAVRSRPSWGISGQSLSTPNGRTIFGPGLLRHLVVYQIKLKQPSSATCDVYATTYFITALLQRKNGLGGVVFSGGFKRAKAL